MYQQIELYMEPEIILDKMEDAYCEISTAEHGFIGGLLKKYQPHKIVEVGVAGGGTTAVIMKCLDLMQTKAQMYSVDLSEQCYRRQGKVTGYQLNEIREELGNISNHKFLLGHILPKVVDEIGGEIDFVVLDTVHSLPGELLDFLCILPYLKDGAVVVLHDVTLNLHDISRKGSYATKIILDAVSGKKYFNYKEELLNIGAIEINEDTRKNIANVFSALSITWASLPSKDEMDCYKNLFQKYYDAECMDLFQIFYRAQAKLLGDEVRNYFFVGVELLETVYYLEEIGQNTEKLYQHFMQYADEVIYILGADDKLYGIVSRGDLYRYYENQDKELKVNQRFQAVSSLDYVAAEKVFQKINTIHEVPVVEQGFLKGVIRSKTTGNRNDWEVYKRELTRVKQAGCLQ